MLRLTALALLAAYLLCAVLGWDWDDILVVAPDHDDASRTPSLATS